MVAQTALKYDVEVQADGRVELSVPFPVGAHVTVFVVELPSESFTDLSLAAQSSLEKTSAGLPGGPLRNALETLLARAAKAE